MKSFKRVSPSFSPRQDGGISLCYDIVFKDANGRYSADYTDYLKFSRSAGCAGSAAWMRNTLPFHGAVSGFGLLKSY